MKYFKILTVIQQSHEGLKMVFRIVIIVIEEGVRI
jgi:hypothetical protein